MENLSLSQLEYKGETCFNKVVIVEAWSDDSYYKILYDPEGHLLTDIGLVQKVNKHLRYNFSLATLDGQYCFTHKERKWQI